LASLSWAKIINSLLIKHRLAEDPRAVIDESSMSASLYLPPFANHLASDY